MRQGRFPVLLCMVVLLAGACSPSVEWLDSRDRAEPLLKRARAKRSEGDLDGAIALYREALQTEQTMALGNLDLALLLHDEKKDYLGAVCHYTRYLDARPDSDKSEMIRKRRQLALQSLVASLAPEGRPSGVARAAIPDEDARKENTELASALQRLKQEQETARSATTRADELSQKNVELQSMIRRLEGELDEFRAVTAAALAEPAREPEPTRSRTAAQRVRKRTYEVMPGDSLSSIAAAVYGDGKKWRTIYEANQDLLGRSQTLRTGQVLTIP